METLTFIDTSAIGSHEDFHAIINTLYHDFGLEQAAKFLYAVMRAETNAKHMVATVQHVDSQTRLILADISESEAVYHTEFFIEVLSPLAYRREFFYESTARTSYCSDTTKTTDLLVVRSLDVMPDAVSLCNIPMFAQNGYSAFLMISSPEKDAFDQRQISRFQLYAQVLGEQLKHEYYPETFKNLEIQEPTTLPEAIEQLRMCNGLTPVVRLVEHVAKTDATVLIQGETGTGKEVVARSIHDLSARKSGPLVRVNCGAIPESLLMSELFGHERGAFTGAVSNRAGFFEQANGGTIFLDEVAELSPAAQVALLRVISTHEIQRVGAIHPIRVNARIIAATHGNLSTMVQEGRFRQDLFYRLKVFPINVPPLRARRSDIPVLSRYFIRHKAAAMHITPPEISQADLHTLCCGLWPGNVRELEYTIERAVILAATGLASKHFTIDTSEIIEAQEPTTEWPSLEGHVIQYIRKVLAHTGGKIKGPDGACAILGIPPSTLRSKMQQYSIDMPAERKQTRVRKLVSYKGRKND